MAGNVPDIWTPAQFVAQTGGTQTRKSLARVDTELAAWDLLKNSHAHTNKRNKLHDLIGACGDYLTTKEAKHDKKAASRFGRPSQLLVNRIAQTKVLSGQAFLRLAFEQHDRQKHVRSNAPGGSVTAARANSRALQSSYAHERTNFENTKVNQGLAGTQTHANLPGGTFVHQMMEQHSSQEAFVQQPVSIRALLMQGFDNLSLADFNTLQAHFMPHYQGMGGLPLVHFARKDERLREMMLIPMNGLLFRTDGRLAGAAGPTDVYKGYAMDTYGNLMAERAQRDWAAGTAQMNHSTLCAGRDVICAGNMKLEAGLIKQYSNDSGHYKPTTQNLALSLWVLKEEYGIDVTAIDVVTDNVTGIAYTDPGAIVAFMAPHMP